VTKLLLSVVLLECMTGIAMAESQEAWRPDGAVDGVQIERRSTPGSHFDELRLTTLSSLSLQRLCDAIYPVTLPARPERRFKRQVLLRETTSDRWTYEQITVPIVSDRDYVMHVRLEQPAASGRCSVSFETEDDPAHPPVPGFVRIPVIRGHWDVFPLSDGRVCVQYRIFSEPGGAVPAFLARGGQRSAAVDFMRIILARANVVLPVPHDVAASSAP
jgi:hypothetical protein